MCTPCALLSEIETIKLHHPLIGKFHIPVIQDVSAHCLGELSDFDHLLQPFLQPFVREFDRLDVLVPHQLLQSVIFFIPAGEHLLTLRHHLFKLLAGDVHQSPAR